MTGRSSRRFVMPGTGSRNTTQSCVSTTGDQTPGATSPLRSASSTTGGDSLQSQKDSDKAAEKQKIEELRAEASRLKCLVAKLEAEDAEPKTGDGSEEGNGGSEDVEGSGNERDYKRPRTDNSTQDPAKNSTTDTKR